MKEYLAVFVDKQGEQQKSYVTAPDVRTAINNLLELRTDCARVTSCRPKPMFED
jgi:hypothetical protein